MPKVKSGKSSKGLRHNPLAEDITEDQAADVRRVPRKKGARSKKDEDAEEAVPSSVTRKVLDLAQEQKAAEESDLKLGDIIVEEEFEEDGDADEEAVLSDVEVDEDGFVLGLSAGATEEEERALAMFMPSKQKAQTGQTLADIIMAKIQEHEAKKDGGGAAGVQSQPEEEGLSPKVIQVYSEIGKWLSIYKSGKIPKAFKVIPSLTNWEEVLSLTDPLKWSPAAMYEAVAIFASNLNPRMAQRFYNLVLLPAVRQNIAKYGKLNFHYYRSMRKALFKPAAFFKGILLPLAMESCTLKEATILASVLGKASIPPMHCAAAMARLASMTPWYGTTSIILGALINKKYSLPQKVVECLVAHFCAFARPATAMTALLDSDGLPLVWHRSLLLFVQRYKYELNDDQKRRLKELLKVHCHEAIGPEIRRELMAPKPGEAPLPSAISISMDMS